MRDGSVQGRFGLILVALSVVLAACSSGDGATTTTSDVAAPAVTTTTTPIATTVAPTTTAAPSTTTTTAPEGAELVLPDNFGDDYRYIWDEMQGFIDRMSIDPHADLTDLIIDPDCDCYQFWVDLFTELEANDWRYTGDAYPETVEFMVVAITSEDEVVLRVVQESAADAVLDADGDIVREEEAKRTDSTVALRRSEEGRWRIFGVAGS